jgi:hypothetical protein
MAHGIPSHVQVVLAKPDKDNTRRPATTDTGSGSSFLQAFKRYSYMAIVYGYIYTIVS